MFTLLRVFDFSAGHTLARSDWSEEKNRQVFGKCSNPQGHGHNYRLEVLVEGPLDSETQMVLDAAKLDEIVHNEVFIDLDHKNLNKEVPWLAGKLPTTEVLADGIFTRLEKAIAAASSTAKLAEIRLWETRRICVLRRASDRKE
ncbi:MAG: 6-carboxytetrahydropterin synthase [Deltaproteobacteria bacterium]|nr:6-carboxytetrahydropterin synthase [Deltaproteobacteria bacterium]